MLYSADTSSLNRAHIFEETATYLSRLHKICAALSSADTAEQVAEIVVADVVPLLGAQAGVVFVLSEDQREFVALRVVGYASHIAESWQRFAASDPTPLGDAVRAQALVVLETGDERRARYPHLADAGADIPGALVAIAAAQGKEVVGAIGFVFADSRQFSESERSFLLLLGQQCGAALARAGAHDPRQSAQAHRDTAPQNLASALRASEERLSLLLAATNEGVWDWQPPTGEVFLSDRWKEIMGLDAAALPSGIDAWATRTHPDDWPQVKAGFEAHMRGETASFVTEHRVRHADGTYRWVLVRGLAMRDTQGQVVRFLGTTSDISERKAADAELVRVIRDLQSANERLEALATTDSLTGLKNERVFQERLTEEFRRARRYQSPLSLVLLDVDHFKLYNDAFGHPAGSRALRHLAQILRKVARETDIVCRYGGEEFAVLLPHANGAEAMALAERLRAAVEAAPWKRRPLTISAGVCTVGPDARQAADLLERADAALYQAKTEGRNRVMSGCADPVSLTLPLEFEL